MTMGVSNDYSLSLLKRWIIFIKERFSLADHVVMITLLTLGNALVVFPDLFLYQADLEKLIIASIIMLFFFFRLRCFDEIKDYVTDCQVNKERPLPRGLLSVSQVKWMFLGLTTVEFLLVIVFFPQALLIYALAVFYSYLMYNEFFIGEILSPHLTTYALTHTFVSALIACTVFIMFGEYKITTLPLELWMYAGVTWGLFNLFEFSRKSYAIAEERDQVPTYTNIFGIPRAVLLSLSQLSLTVGIPYYLNVLHKTNINLFDWQEIIAQIALAMVVVLAGGYFAIKKTIFSAKLFRSVCTFYLITYFLLLIVLKVI